MKKNLRFLPLLITIKKQIHFKNLLFVISFFIASNIFSQNPLLLQNPFPGGTGRSIQKIVSTTTGKTFFNTIDNNNHFSDLWGLWTTDGTQAGTTKLILNSPGYTNTNTKEATLLTPLGNDKIVFAGDNEYGYGELWVSDGTEPGTNPLEIFTTAFSGGAVTNIVSLGNIVIYSAYANGAHSQLGKTDGTPGGTPMIYDFGSNPANPNSLAYFKTIGNLVYFELTNGTTHNNEIWRTDGTTGGTYQVKDLGTGYGFASDFMSFNNNIYFITISSTYGDYIWKSDGTTVGTAPLKQISATFNYENLFPSYAAVENNIIVANNALYFTANDGIHGRELWKTDGTEAGTVMTFDFYQGSTGSNPYWLTVLNNQLYFTANSSFFPQGTALYFYNGSQFSQPISTASNPSNLTVQNNTILFSAARNTFDGNELWITDGGTANTFEIANINPVANASSNPSLISVSGNSAYFVASFDANGDGIDDPCIYKYAIPQKIWMGSVSSDASDANNWFPSGVPTSADNVLVSANPVNSINNPSFLSVNDLTINGGTVDVVNGILFIYGNFFNAGTVNHPLDNGILAIINTDGTHTNHTIGGAGIYNGQLTIAGGTNVHLTSDFKINDFRNDGGKIYLGPYNFQFDTYTNFPPQIVTDSLGHLTMLAGSSPVFFGVGTDSTSFTPVTITNNGASDYFSVNVKNGVYSNGTSGNEVTQQSVNKTWFIDKQTSGAANVNITLQWSASDELTGFNRSNVYLNHYTSGAWDSGTPGVASGSDPYTFTRTGFTSFSPFSISSSTSVLPVTLISFNANKLNNTVQLNWQTSSEKNISFYTIERSADGNAFSKLDQIDALVTGASIKNYSFTDNQPFQGTNFYRLKMIDADGKFTYSKIVAIKMDDKNSTLQIFPNPVKDILNVQINGANENAIIQIIDMNGRKVKEEKISLNGNTSVSVDINNLSKGTYNLLLKSKSVNEQKKFVKE